MAGYDISASASSALTTALTFNNDAGIYFDSMSQGIHSGDNSAGPATATAARSLQQAPNPQPDSVYADYGSTPVAASGNNSMLYIIGGAFLVVIITVVFIFKR